MQDGVFAIEMKLAYVLYLRWNHDTWGYYSSPHAHGVRRPPILGYGICQEAYNQPAENHCASVKHTLDLQESDARPCLSVRSSPMDPSIQSVPALGLKVRKYYLHWATWILRVSYTDISCFGASFARALGRSGVQVTWSPDLVMVNTGGPKYNHHNSLWSFLLGPI